MQAEAITPEHLGGHMWKTHVDEGALDYIMRNYEVHTMLDIGCGPGGMVDLARSKGIEAFGVDGDPALFKEPRNWTVMHDYTTGKLPLLARTGEEESCSPYNLSAFDLGWSVEFVEHIDEKFIPNFIDTFQRCKYLVMTAAPPGWHGHHHVNLQNFNYWKSVLEDAGFTWDSDATLNLRKYSTMVKPFMARTGAFYVNQNRAS